MPFAVPRKRYSNVVYSIIQFGSPCQPLISKTFAHFLCKIDCSPRLRTAPRKIGVRGFRGRVMWNPPSHPVRGRPQLAPLVFWGYRWFAERLNCFISTTLRQFLCCCVVLARLLAATYSPQYPPVTLPVRNCMPSLVLRSFMFRVVRSVSGIDYPHTPYGVYRLGIGYAPLYGAIPYTGYGTRPPVRRSLIVGDCTRSGAVFRGRFPVVPRLPLPVPS